MVRHCPGCHGHVYDEWQNCGEGQCGPGDFDDDKIAACECHGIEDNAEMKTLRAQRDALLAVCKAIVDDATADIDGKKRVWPIRMENYRKLMMLCEQ